MPLELRRRECVQTLMLAPLASAAATPISIDGGRQLFFDDYLIAESTLERTWHLPALHPASPVLQPQTPLEMNNGERPVACPFCDGIFYDPKDRLLKTGSSRCGITPAGLTASPTPPAMTASTGPVRTWTWSRAQTA